MIHQRQGLPLGLEPSDDLFAVHPRFDDLQRHHAAHGLGLLGHVDDAHAALSDDLEQLVRADDRAEALGVRTPIDRVGITVRHVEQAEGTLVGEEEGLDPATQESVAPRTPRPGMRTAPPRSARRHGERSIVRRGHHRPSHVPPRLESLMTGNARSGRRGGQAFSRIMVHPGEARATLAATQFDVRSGTDDYPTKAYLVS
jgi:hypothetical protein